MCCKLGYWCMVSIILLFLQLLGILVEEFNRTTGPNLHKQTCVNRKTGKVWVVQKAYTGLKSLYAWRAGSLNVTDG